MNLGRPGLIAPYDQPHPEEVETAGKERKIRQFLIESLPPTEERIREPMNPQCEVCVVLPAYSERKYILRPLASLAEQEGVGPDQYEVIVVVNNPPRVPERDQFQVENDYIRRVNLYNEGVGNNQETLQLIRYINGEDIPIVLTDREKEAVTAIRRSGLKVFAVDKASEGKTLPQEEANVGGARNRGVAEAVERFHDQIGRNGIIVQSDAEVRFHESYIQDVITIFKESPELIGISGYVDFENSPEDYALFRGLFSDSGVQQVYIEVATFILGQEKPGEKLGKEPDAETPAFSGSNMASRAFEAAMVGGVPKLPGGEDPAFGYRLAQIGKTEKISTLKTMSLNRFSPRTTTGTGQLYIEFAEAAKRNGEILVESPEEIAILEKMKSDLTKAINAHQTAPEQLGEISSIHGQLLFSEEQLQMLSQKIQSLEGVSGNEVLRALGRDEDLARLFKSIRAHISEIIKPIPLEEAIAKLIAISCADPLLEAKYISTKAQMIEKENDLKKRGRKILQSLVDILFKDGKPALDNSTLMNLIRLHKENLGLSNEEMAYLEEGDVVLSIMVEEIAKTETKQQAMEAMAAAFKDSVSPVAENPLRFHMIELEALRDAAEER